MVNFSDSAVPDEMQVLEAHRMQQLWARAGRVAANTVLQSMGAAVNADEGDRTAKLQVSPSANPQPSLRRSASCTLLPV